MDMGEACATESNSRRQSYYTSDMYNVTRATQTIDWGSETR